MNPADPKPSSPTPSGAGASGGSASAAGRGVLVIVSSPSGAGKTTLTRRLLAEFPTLEFSVSYTTRSMRTGERDGVDYHFVDPSHFGRMVDAGDFAEYAQVHGNWYGTAKAPVEAALGAGRDVIFDVDWQGGRALSQQWPTDSLKIFILPPDLATLAQRLRNRATDAPEVIDRRLRKAIEELGHFDEYPNLIVNDVLDRAYGVLRAFYQGRRGGLAVGRGAPLSRPDLAPALAELAAAIDDNEATSPDAHARALIYAGEASLGPDPAGGASGSASGGGSGSGGPVGPVAAPGR